MVDEKSRLHSSSRLTDEVEQKNMVGRVSGQHLLCRSPVRSLWLGLGCRICVPPLMLALHRHNTHHRAKRVRSFCKGRLPWTKRSPEFGRLLRNSTSCVMS